MKPKNKANWFETYVFGTENPIFQQLNRVPGSPPFAGFHDALNYQGIMNQASIIPAYAISQAAASKDLILILQNVENANNANHSK